MKKPGTVMPETKTKLSKEEIDAALIIIQNPDGITSRMAIDIYNLKELRGVRGFSQIAGLDLVKKKRGKLSYTKDGTEHFYSGRDGIYYLPKDGLEEYRLLNTLKHGVEWLHRQPENTGLYPFRPKTKVKVEGYAGVDFDINEVIKSILGKDIKLTIEYKL